MVMQNRATNQQLTFEYSRVESGFSYVDDLQFGPKVPQIFKKSALPRLMVPEYFDTILVAKTFNEG